MDDSKSQTSDFYFPRSPNSQEKLQTYDETLLIMGGPQQHETRE